MRAEPVELPESDEREAAGARLRVYLEQRWPRSRGGFRALCRDAAIGPETLYRWLRGETEPDLGSIRRVAIACGTTRAELVAVMDGQQAPIAWPADVGGIVRQVMLEVMDGRDPGKEPPTTATG